MLGTTARTLIIFVPTQEIQHQVYARSCHRLQFYKAMLTQQGTGTACYKCKPLRAIRSCSVSPYTAGNVAGSPKLKLSCTSDKDIVCASCGQHSGLGEKHCHMFVRTSQSTQEPPSAAMAQTERDIAGGMLVLCPLSTGAYRPSIRKKGVDY